MKKSLSLVLVALLFVVLGCSLDRFTGGGGDDQAPTPVSDVTASDEYELVNMVRGWQGASG